MAKTPKIDTAVSILVKSSLTWGIFFAKKERERGKTTPKNSEVELIFANRRREKKPH